MEIIKENAEIKSFMAHGMKYCRINRGHIYSRNHFNIIKCEKNTTLSKYISCNISNWLVIKMI